MSSGEWDALTLRDQEAIAWWQFVEASGYRSMSDEHFKAIPVQGGQRSKAFRRWQDARTALMPED